MNSLNRNNRKIVIISLISILFSLACGLTARPTTTEFAPPPVVATVEVQPQPQLPSVITDEDQVLIGLYERSNPAVVNIITYDEQSGDFPSGQGSGFIFDNNGHIITNAHVIHSATDIEIVFSDSNILAGEVVGEDFHSDLAVVKIDALPDGVTPLPLGDIEQVAVGQTVVAIGNPFGLGGTLTRGIVSALGRTIPALTPFSIPQAIQTDAPINPGNSGGPLMNLSGEVIGVNAQIETNGESRANSGVGFAIPVSIVSLVVPSLIQDGVHHWAWLGVRGGSLNPNQVQAMDLPFNRGAYMSEIIPDGPADNARLQGSSRQATVNGRQTALGGDIITAIDGQPVHSFEDLLIYISLHTTPGQEVNLTIWRDGEYREVTVIMEERPSTDALLPFP